ncbi:1-acyl-sn-glycerol-3-phosphate acyltransferase [Collinsella sp. zg1085]|uniref:lysophospholipid acyltransferase family protein n=1 Tax=Collinsella sp. zg1085 TaxID=2844380 RepID=UPI001C0DBAB7|nr:lysophospholipid acyltransferase family protein [Collinsella sp. zg1085]QWT17023.1 1-acyl-sn-glycerol-3-phosphate acyltransferase [Collinsella sp. zg1085]
MTTRSLDEFYDKPLREFPLLSRILLRCALVILWLGTKLLWRWSIDGATHLNASSDASGRIIICNHTSMGEVPVIVAHLMMQGRAVRSMAKSEFFKHGLLAQAFSRAGAFPVERGTADMKALRRAQRALMRGEDLLIFPEGTRVRTDTQPVEIHGGFALIAQMAKAPVVPMAVCGFRDITPVGSHISLPRTCWLAAGSSLSLNDAPASLGRRERLAWLEKEAMRRVYELRDTLRAQHPGRS